MGLSLDEFEETEFPCAQCEDPLLFEEDVMLLQVMRPVINSATGNVELVPMLDGQGNYDYDVFFLHFKCWEEIFDDAKENAEDLPPILDDLSILTCDCCGSSIREYETVASVGIGELLQSKRSPSGEGRATTLAPSAPPEILCVYCISTINENWLTFWDDGISVDGECIECQHARCWRGFDCECTCHDK